MFWKNQKTYRLLLSFIFGVITFNGISQNSRSNFYLVDHPDFRDSDTQVVDSLLKDYHACKTDTCKINVLSTLVDVVGRFDKVSYFKHTINFIDDFLSQNENIELENYGLDRIGDTYKSMGEFYYYDGNIKESMDCFFKSLNYYEKLDDEINKAYLLNNLGLLNSEQGDTAIALKFYQEARTFFEKEDDSNGKAMVYNNIGLLYIEFNQINRAKVYFDKCITELKDENNLDALATVYHNLGGAYSTFNMSDTALVYYYKALTIRRKINDQKGLSYTLKNIGGILNEKGNISKAEKMGIESLKIADENNYPRNKRNAYDLLAAVNRKKGNFKKAYEYHKKYIEVRDSLINEETQNDILKQSLQYEYEKKAYQDSLKSIETIKLHDKEIAVEKEKRKQQNIVLSATTGGLVLILLFLIIIYRKLQLTRKQKLIIEELADKLKDLDRTKTKFFNNVAHELRTPLTLMIGHMESVLNGRYGGLNENQYKSVAVAKSNSDRLIDLVSEILDLGKLESNKIELTKKPILLKPFLDRIFFTFESLAHQFGISLSMHYLLDDKVVLLIDDRKIEKVLNNLLHNAIKFTPRNGSVSLTVMQTQDNIQLKIKDSGIGIPEEDLTTIFERYFQSGKPEDSAQGGTGIGLTIVKEFVELHRGKVYASNKIEAGSEFVVELPLLLVTDQVPKEDTDTYTGDKSPSYPILKEQHTTILVVDDHYQMQQYLKSILSPYSRILIASDGIEALEILGKNKVDLITIDLMMPNMNGFELLKKLKETDQLKKIPTIMLTARNTEEDKIEGLTIGVNDFISKPFSQLELIARVANLLENKKERENSTLEKEEKNEHKDNKFLIKLRAIILENIANSAFGVNDLSDTVGISEKQLTRTLKSISGLTPLKFIREIKLLKAEELLKNKTHHTVAEVCYAVGFEKPSYFSNIYQERFGKKPSNYF